MSINREAEILRDPRSGGVDRTADQTVPVFEPLKQRIVGELFPLLVEDLRRGQALVGRPKQRSPESGIEVQQRARTLLLRFLILRLANARGLAGGRGQPLARWRPLCESATLVRAGRKINDERWRQGIDRLWRAYFHAMGRVAEPLPPLSTSVLASVIADLSHTEVGRPGGNGMPNDSTVDPRLLGEVYQKLLSTTIDERNGRATANPMIRKASGSFYTPAAVIDYIVAQTLDPLLARGEPKWNPRSRKTTGPSVLDPAMGCGYFLLAAVHRIARHWRLAYGTSDVSSERRLVRRAVECMYGIDLDPTAVELAQATIWLEFRLDRREMFGVGQRLLCGNALLDERFDDCDGNTPPFPSQFDAVIGNPPYGAKLSPLQRQLACQRLPQMRHNGDTAVGFLQRSHAWLSQRGRCGLIVPKALTYSFSWRRLREHLAGRIVELVDVSRVWAEVRLEQVIVLSAADHQAPAYQSRVWREGALSPPVAVEWRLAKRLEAWPCGLTQKQQRLVHRLSRKPATLGELFRTFRGLPLQARVTAQGAMPILGGRDLVRWGVRSISGHVPQDIDPSPFAGERLLFQNIVAHLVRPHPQIRLIGCHDASGRATLDTVNNVVARRGDLDLHGALGLLHAPFVNWYAYSVIYNQAIRTMHFDQYFLNKIPLPTNWPGLLAGIAPLSRSIEESVATELAAGAEIDEGGLQSLRDQRRQAADQIDQLVRRAYGWRSAAR